MLQRWEICAYLDKLLQVYLSNRDRFFFGRQFGENDSPGIDDHRVSVAFEFFVWLPT